MKTRHTTILIILFCFAVIFANRQLRYGSVSNIQGAALISCGLIFGLLLATLIGSGNKDENKPDDN